MRFRPTPIIMPLHDTLEALPLGDAFDINPITLLKQIGPKNLTKLHITRLFKFP